MSFVESQCKPIESSGNDASARVNKSRSCCVVVGCSNYPAKRPELAYHKFPKDDAIKEKWLQVIRRKDFHPAQSSVVCSKHFERGMYRVPQGLKQRALLKPDAMPTLFPSYPSYLLPKNHLKRKERTLRQNDNPDEEAGGSYVSSSSNPMSSAGQVPAPGARKRS